MQTKLFLMNSSALIKALPFCAHKFKSQKPFTAKPMSSMLLSGFRSSKKFKNKDRLPDTKSPLNDHETLPFSSYSPLAVRARGADIREASLQMENTCRIFENYLVEMIVEQGKIKDLMDVEELLYYWKNLKCPIFIDLVCRFYVEICKDLFSSDSEEGSSIPTNG